MRAILSIALTCLSTQDGDRPDANLLFEQARTFIPKYDGENRDFLTADEERDVTAAARILEASLALEPEGTVACWWLGHCEVLLGENLRNRDREEEARTHYEAALHAFERSLELDPASYWAHYARAMALRNLEDFWPALVDYGEAIDLANDVIEGGPAEDPRVLDARFVRFKARQWRADTRMSVLEFELSREEYRSFYADNGNNQWDLGYSLAETYLRARDLEGATRTYQDVLAVEEFRPFDSTYAQLAYIAGLSDDRAAAADWLDQALENERVPGLYLRLWLWILAPEDRRAAAEEDLRGFLEHPPGDVPEWDLVLGRFTLGEGTAADFLAAAREELERRKRVAEPLGDLTCEAWFYVGLRHETDAAALEGEERAARHRSALEAYREALTFAPRQFKWEWEYARTYFARLAERLDLAARPGFELEDHRIVPLEGERLTHPEAVGAGRLERLLWHSPGAPRSEGLVAFREAPPRPGDLLQCVIERPDGTRVAARFVVDAE